MKLAFQLSALRICLEDAAWQGMEMVTEKKTRFLRLSIRYDHIRDNVVRYWKGKKRGVEGGVLISINCSHVSGVV